MDHSDADAVRTISVSAVVLARADGAVATVRKRGTDRFMLPGGKWEAGESPLECAVREIEEELGLVLPGSALTPLGRFDTATANEPGFRLVSEVFRAEVDDDEAHGPGTASGPGGGPPAPRAEIAELRWVWPEEVAGLPEADCAPWAPLLVRVAREALTP